MSKRKYIILFSTIGICTVLCVVLFINIFRKPIISYSPDNLYKITYNKSERKTTGVNLETGVKTYTIISDVPVTPTFIWSPNSQYYAEVFEYQDGKMHNIIYDVKNGMGIGYNTKPVIEELSKTIDITDDNINEYVTMVKFLDNQYLLMEFKYTPTSGQSISGWYIYDFIGWTVRDVHITK